MAKTELVEKPKIKAKKTDPRISKAILDCLNISPPAVIVDVGAGRGGYSSALAKSGFDILAVESPEAMPRQGKPSKRIQWIEGTAENLPLESNSVDAVISILSIQYVKNLEKALREMIRVLKKGGPMVIFTIDPRFCPQYFWLADYFNEVISQAYKIYPPIEEFQKLLEQVGQSDVVVRNFPLPHDIVENFFFSGWRRPELYLEKRFCAGVPGLAALPPDILERSQQRLQRDLECGFWAKKYKQILVFNECDCGYRFLTTIKE